MGGWGVSAVTRWRWDLGRQGAPQDDPNPHCGRCLSQHRHRSDQSPPTASSSTDHSLGNTAELTDATKARHRPRGAQKAAAHSELPQGPPTPRPESRPPASQVSLRRAPGRSTSPSHKAQEKMWKAEPRTQTQDPCGAWPGYQGFNEQTSFGGQF